MILILVLVAFIAAFVFSVVTEDAAPIMMTLIVAFVVLVAFTVTVSDEEVTVTTEEVVVTVTNLTISDTDTNGGYAKTHYRVCVENTDEDIADVFEVQKSEWVKLHIGDEIRVKVTKTETESRDFYEYKIIWKE